MSSGRGMVPADRPSEGQPRREPPTEFVGQADPPDDQGTGRTDVMSVAGVTLDVARREVSLPPDDQQVVLTPLQAALLAHLMSRPGRECSREELMCDALGYPVAVGSRTVDVHIATLRNKLKGALSIKSVRGVGYTLQAGGGANA